MADITSLVIYRRSANFWELVSNLSPEPISRDAYRGSGFEPYVSIQSSNGTTVVNGVSVSVVSYVDEYGANTTPSFSSASELMQFLLDEGFFEDDSNGGSGATVFTELNDTPNNYFGNGEKLVRVNAGETALEFVTLAAVLNVDLQEVTDVGSNTTNPIKVNNPDESNGITYGYESVTYDTDDFSTTHTYIDPTVNRVQVFPDKDGTFAMLSDVNPVTGTALWQGKGWVGTTANVAAGEEVGDIYKGSFFDAGESKWYWYPQLQWLGGDKTDIANFSWSYRDDFI